MKYRTSPEISDGMKVIRQPMSMSALMVIRFIWNTSYLIRKVLAIIFSGNTAYVYAEFSIRWIPSQLSRQPAFPALLSNRPSTKIFIRPSANYQITIGVIEHD